MVKKFKKFLKTLGPGFISGAADNDPAGMATYTQVGAQFGFGQLWTALFALPLLVSVQEACARIGAVTGKGLASVIKENYGSKILYSTVTLLLITNTINIGANIGAMSEALRLIIPIPFIIITLFFSALILTLEIFTSYRVYSKYLKWLSCTAFLYFLTIFIAPVPWKEVFVATWKPNIEWSFAFILIIAGNIGTTLAPYLFFWETSEEVEEDRLHHLIKKDGEVTISNEYIKKIRTDNFVGMFISQLITWSIIVVGATVLYNNGIKDLHSATEAAKALEPLVQTFPHAGTIAKILFALSIIGSGLLVVPILSGSVAYAIAEVANWKEGLNMKLNRARGFYGVITIATVIGLIVNFIGIDPIKLLIYTSVFNGVCSIPLLFLIGKISSDKKIMGKYKNGILSRIFIWIAFIVMTIILIGMIAAH